MIIDNLIWIGYVFS